MTENDLVVAVLAFVRTHGPIGAVARLTGALAAALAVFYLWAKVTARFSSHKTFDVGGEFDHFYSRFRWGACSGVVWLIYAGYLALWLWRWPTSPQLWWLHEPSYSVFYGMLDTLIVVGLVAMGCWGFAKAAWFGLRWLRMEARGVLWHIADSGEPYRVVWLRRNGEYFYYPEMTRDKRAGEELEKLRERRIRLGKVSAIAVVAIIVWLHCQTFIGTLYPVPLDLVRQLPARGAADVHLARFFLRRDPHDGRGDRGAAG